MSNAVDNPILGSPFEEPPRHWDFGGATPRIASGRRSAGYYGVVQTERARGSRMESEQIPLPLVNELRARVRSWRERCWPGVTRVTRDLLEHWHREDRRPLFFAQREAVETIIWLNEASAAERQGIEVPEDAPNDPESLRKGYRALRRTCAKMATGSGKTTVMAMVAAWSILNKLANRQDPRFADVVLVVCPNLTVKERLQVLRPKAPGNYYASFDLVPAAYRDLLSRGRVLVTNWHVFSPQRDAKRSVVRKGAETDAAFVRRVLERDLGRSGEVLVLNDEAHHAYRPAPRPEDENQLELEGLSADERAEAKLLADEATVWVGGLDRVHKARGVKLVVDVSATPFYLKGSGHPEGEPLPWIVSDFGLVDAIECGITKIPRIPVADDAGHPDPKYFKLWHRIVQGLGESERGTARRQPKPEAIWKEAEGALVTLAGKWKATFDAFARAEYPVPPALIVVAANTSLATLIAEALEGGLVPELAGDRTLQIDSKVLAAAEAEEGATKADAAQRLRVTTATVGKAAWPDDRPPEGFEDDPTPPGKDIRAVVSVGMLTEGWDAQNVTQILGLRAFSSQLLCEQVVGRALRRMSYDVDPATGLLQPEYADIFGVPFEVIPVKGAAAAEAPAQPPSTLVQAVDTPLRRTYEIEFPRVEGFVVDVRRRLRCDVAQVPEVRVEPQVEPTRVETRVDLGRVAGTTPNALGGGEELDREPYYATHRLQSTAFEIAREVTEALAGGRTSAGSEVPPAKKRDDARLLFPQVLRIVQDFLATRLALAPGARPEEVALAKYRELVVGRLLDSIEPDESAGEAPLLPRLERFRPVGSTAQVQFRTTKPARPTDRSHVSHVVLDSGAWGEGNAAWHLDHCDRVNAWVKNERLDFEIPYHWEDRTRAYRPDFLVRLADGADREINLIIEVKGEEDEQDRAKYAAARRWVRAVNHHGRFGRWAFLLCNEPNRLGDLLARFDASTVGIPLASAARTKRPA